MENEELMMAEQTVEEVVPEIIETLKPERRLGTGAKVGIAAGVIALVAGTAVMIKRRIDKKKEAKATMESGVITNVEFTEKDPSDSEGE